jgi:hypothetical protein
MPSTMTVSQTAQMIRIVVVCCVISMSCIAFGLYLPSIISNRVESYRRERAEDYGNVLRLGLNFISAPYDNQTHTVPMFSVASLEKCLGD